MNAAWRSLAEELARWRDAGRVAEFWWRDDDAARPTPALSRLLALAHRTATPLALAVVPLSAEEGLCEGAGQSVTILQHGTDHRNRADAGGKKTEFAASESPAAATARLVAARDRLCALAGARFLPVLAPPWNRLPGPLAAPLAAAGFRGLSLFGARAVAQAAPGLAQVNTHADLIGWRTGRGFAGEDEVLSAAIRHLAAKREGRADAAEATGWLSHHADHDAAAWDFLERLFETLRPGAALRWCGAREIFHVS